MRRQQVNRGFRNDDNQANDSVRQDSLEMRQMGSNASLNQIPVQYVMAPQYPSPGPMQAPVGAHPAVYMIPANQYMVRDGSTPMPHDFEHRTPTIPSLACTIFKRLLSAIFIIADSFMSWWNYGAQSGKLDFFALLLGVNSDSTDELDVFSGLNGGSGGKQRRLLGSTIAKGIECNDGSDAWMIAKAVFTGIATAWACFQIINMIGETMLEYHQIKRTRYEDEDAENGGQDEKQRKGEEKMQRRETCFQGFQILHGYVETFIAMLLGDVPQVIFAVILGAKCKFDIASFLQNSGWMFLKELKNFFRKSTCKQQYTPCCHECCKDCCCVYKCDIPCTCTLWTYRPLGCCCNAKVCEFESYEYCPGGFCTRNGRCFGDISEDPKWALRWEEKMEKILALCSTAVFVMTLLRLVGVLK